VDCQGGGWGRSRRRADVAEHRGGADAVQRTRRHVSGCALTLRLVCLLFRCLLSPYASLRVFAEADRSGLMLIRNVI
jgi:hypothetical protein